MPSPSSNINPGWRQYKHNATTDKISNPNPNRIFVSGRHNKKPHDDPNTTKLLHQSNIKMSKSTILISIYLAALVIYTITVMI